MSGYGPIGSPAMATSPSRTVRIAITIATIGRSMKKRAMVLPPSRRRRHGGGGRLGLLRGGLLRADGGTRLHLREPIDHDAVPGLQPRVDLPQLPHPYAGLDGPDLDLVVAPHDRHLEAPLELVDGPLRHQDRPLLDLGHGADFCVLPRPQEVPGI